eukprot:GFYU01009681.1.p1 GENE.GFYU01009681.1~~GFYU01009681.1.p1  ORF type:complete len:397 (+),score=132.10 GFYU01009681.1:39-1229(+)
MSGDTNSMHRLVLVVAVVAAMTMVHYTHAVSLEVQTGTTANALVEAARRVQCEKYVNCPTCATNLNCGWCVSDNSAKCVSGNIVGPTCNANCTVSYEYAFCSGEPCGHMHHDCQACVKDPFCVWCHSNEKCVEGNMLGPIEPGECKAYAHGNCGTYFECAMGTDGEPMASTKAPENSVSEANAALDLGPPDSTTVSSKSNKKSKVPLVTAAECRVPSHGFLDIKPEKLFLKQGFTANKSGVVRAVSLICGDVEKTQERSMFMQVWSRGGPGVNGTATNSTATSAPAALAAAIEFKCPSVRSKVTVVYPRDKKYPMGGGSMTQGQQYDVIFRGDPKGQTWVGYSSTSQKEKDEGGCKSFDPLVESADGRSFSAAPEGVAAIEMKVDLDRPEPKGKAE